MTPFEEAAKKFPEVTADNFSHGSSTVTKTEKNKIRKKVKIDNAVAENEEEL